MAQQTGRKDDARDKLNKAENAGHEAMDKGQQAFDKAKEAAGHAVGSAREAAGSALSGAREAAGQALSGARDAAGQALSTAGETVTHAADSGAATVGGGMRSLAGTIRDQGPHEGMLGDATSTVARTLEQGGRYLEKEGVTGMAEDVTDMIKKNPVPAVLVAIGIGFLLGQLTSSRS